MLDKIMFIKKKKKNNLVAGWKQKLWRWPWFVGAGFWAGVSGDGLSLLYVMAVKEAQLRLGHPQWPYSHDWKLVLAVSWGAQNYIYA